MYGTKNEDQLCQYTAQRLNHELQIGLKNSEVKCAIRLFLSCKMLICLLYCCFFSPVCSANQSTKLDTSKAQFLEETGRAFYAEAQYDSSFVYLENAAHLYQQNQLWTNWYKVVSKNATGFIRQLAFEKSVHYLQKKLDVYLADVGENDEFAAKIYGRMGIAFNKAGETQQALEAYETALQIFHQIQLQTSFVASIYKNTANIYTRNSAYDKAIPYFQKAIAIQTELKNYSKLYVLYCDLSNAYYYTKQAEKELRCYQKAAALPNISEEEKGILDQLLSSYYQTQGEQKQAMNYAQFALEKLLPTENWNYIANAYKQIGDLYSEQEAWATAQTYLEKAKQAAYQNYGRFHRETVKFHTGLGGNYEAQGKWAEALVEYQNALICLFPKLKKHEAVMENPSIEAFYIEPWIMTVLQLKGGVFYKMYEKNGKKTDLEKALAAYELSLLELKMLQYDYDTEASKLYVNENWHQYYERAVQASLQLWTITGDDVYLKNAFLWAEKSKANLLIEQLKASSAQYMETLPVPKNYLEREQNLKKQAYIFEELKWAAPSDSLITAYTDSIHIVQQARGFLLDTLQQLFPNYPSTHHNIGEINVAAIQKKLAQKQVLVSYFVGDSTIYVFALTNEELLAKQVPKTDALLQVITEFVAVLQLQDFRESNYQKYVKGGWRIYKTLLQPILLGVEQQSLVIVPDGLLHYIPFEALLSQSTNSKQVNFYPNHLHYLIEDCAISYASSATLWLHSLQKKTHKNSHQAKPLLAYAPVFDQQEIEEDEHLIAMRSCSENALNQLKKSELEARNIHRIWGGDLYLRQEATKKRFLDLASQYRILHLATHACLSEQGNHFNRIYFAQSEALSTYDFYGLNLQQTELVSLSACNTGTGNLVRGEGLMSLSRGFFSAGCPSVLMSLWSVPDAATANIMTDFYRLLRKGQSKSQALRNAKLHYLQNHEDEALYPLHWSAFVLMGNEQAIFRERHHAKKWKVVGVCLGIFLVLGIGVWWRWK